MNNKYYQHKKLKPNNNKLMIYRFFIYGLCGWNVEVLWTGLCALIKSGDYNMMGHTSVWMFFIYGAGGLLLERIHNSISGLRWWERGTVWMYSIFIIELLSGFLLSLINIYPWKYEGIFSVGGFIRLDYAPLWFTLGMVFELLKNKACMITKSST